MWLHMEGQRVCMTKMHEGYMWRSIRNVTERHTTYMWNVTRNMNLKFIKNLSTPWHGPVDQDWRSKSHVLKGTSQPPDRSALALLCLPSQSGKGTP